MSIAIAFLSGKGGSGKTTLALSMANLLCKCNVRTLLVDCDMSTNGATYFYESQLIAQNKDAQFQVSSFEKVLNESNHIDRLAFLQIEEKLDFIPSFSVNSEPYLLSELSEQRYHLDIQIKRFVKWAECNYEVILFDCQAGYTELLPALLPLMDVDLFILEADSISASAMRNLHLKIGGVLGHARLYQIFNKATKEEFDIYSKIVGTFFTNIGTLLFDWKIRQAFSRSQIPDIENTSAEYGSDLCNISKIILSDKIIQKKLDQFSSQLHYRKLEEERKEVEKSLYNIASRPLKIIRTKILWGANIVMLIFILSNKSQYQKAMEKLFRETLLIDNIDFPFAQASVLCLVIIMVTISILLNERARSVRLKRWTYEQQLKDLDKRLKNLSRICNEKDEND